MEVKDEIVLPDGEDNPTSLAVHKDLIYAGVNRSQQKVKANENDHLRVVSMENNELNSKNVFHSSSVDEYQKCTQASASIVAFCSATSPGTLYAVSPKDLELLYSKKAEGEINDVHISPEGSKVAFCTAKKIVVLETVSGKQLLTIDRPKEGDKSFSKIRFISEDYIVAALNITGKKGVVLSKYSVSDGSVAVSKKLSSRIKAVVAFDAQGKFAAVGTSDFSIVIVSSDNLKQLFMQTQVHPFAITSISINPAGTVIGSTSVAGTVHFLDIPADGEFHRTRATVKWSVISVILTLLMAIAIQFLVKQQIIDALIPNRSLLRFSQPVSELVETASQTSTMATETIAPIIEEDAVEKEEDDDIETESVTEYVTRYVTESEASPSDDRED